MKFLNQNLSYPKFSFVLLVSLIVSFLVFILVINLIIDPYNEYQIFRKTSYRSNATSAFPIFNKLKRGKYSVVFGTSTSAPIDKECVKDNVLNFSMSLYGEPERIYNALKRLPHEDVLNIKKIYYAIEHNVLHNIEVTNTDINYTSMDEFYIETVKNIQKPKIIASLDWIAKKFTGKADSYISEYGVYTHLKPRAFNTSGTVAPIVFKHDPEQVVYLKKLVEFAKMHNIKVVVLRTVVSKYFLERVDFDSLEKHFNRILEATPYFYSLMWIDGISENNESFRDPIHPSYDITKKQMHLLLSPEAEKYKITRHNIKEHIKYLKQKID